MTDEETRQYISARGHLIGLRLDGIELDDAVQRYDAIRSAIARLEPQVEADDLPVGISAVPPE